MIDASEEINNYLNGNLTYYEGVAILSMHIKNKVLPRNLLLRQNPKKLEYELKKILKIYESKKATKQQLPRNAKPQTIVGSAVEQTISTITEDSSVQTATHRNSADSYFDQPDNHTRSNVRSELEELRKQKYRKRGHLHGQLHNASSEQERFKLCRQLHLLQKEIDKLNQDYRSVLSGEIPTNYLKRSRTAEEYIRIKNLKLYVSRYQKKIETASSLEERARYQKKLEEYETELKTLL